MNAGLQTWDANGTNELRQRYRYEQRQVKVFLEQKRERECKRGQDLVRKTKVPPSRYEGWQQSLHRRKAFSAKFPAPKDPKQIFLPRGNLYSGQRERDGGRRKTSICTVALSTTRNAHYYSGNIIKTKSLVLKVSTRFEALGRYAPNLHLILSPGY